MRRSSLVGLFLIVLAYAAIAPAASARDGAHPKLDPRLVDAVATAAPDDELPLIVFGDGIAAALSRTDARVRRTLHGLSARSIRVRARQLPRLLESPGVTWATLDAPVLPTLDTLGLTNPFPLLSTLHPTVVGAPAAWSKGYTGAGVGIAVIDSGVGGTADFGTRLTSLSATGTPLAGDAYGHGTFVAAIAAGSDPYGRYVGIAPGAKVYGFGVSGADGVRTSDIVSALDWILANRAAHNIRVVNLSLSEMVESTYTASVLDTAVERLWRAGIVVVASSGNRGAGAVSFAPANDPFVITVGAVDAAGTASTADDTVPAFSSRGTTADGFAKPELSAPGRHIASALPGGSTLLTQAPLGNLLGGGYATMSGTSFAAPQVAGAAAVLLQQHPEWTPDQIKWVLVKTARPLPSGAVVLDLAAAASFTGTPGAANVGIAPTVYGLDGSTTADFTSATWNSATWNSATWNSATWNSATWNSATWNFSAWD